MNIDNLLVENERFIIEHAVGRLCNALRIFGEEHIRFPSLVEVDKEEAVNNYDRAFELILENFHTLYDVSKKYFNFFEFADSALLILLRNAIHHRDHNLFKSWNAQMVLNDGYQKFYGASFLLCSYKPIDDDAHVMKYYYKLEDILDRLDRTRNSPYRDNHLSQANSVKQLKLLNDQLGFSKIIEYGQKERYPLGQIYINMLPILNGALKRVFERLLQIGIKPIGYDDEIYLKHFTTEGFFDFDEVLFTNLKII
ncbi:MULTISPECIES: hypothetical protein [Acinetobacter calcoaceticus/baumannii complex]|nr:MULTISPECIES: hypothetical protein [Acinetobacter calcoaceticus/baumannii complex]EME4725357.1 hypothetical protein [Acinetobacter baumannii]MBD0079173.1 hypothetical protein [Acinetobacter baumannii]MBJ8429378.1 hypothetical protein [Acinetobacter pittii]MBP4674140.1 hypothetical protein [Acinetobacter baumannii]MBP5035455.1 hypothetical protein [Acinetobacter baumannii]